MLNGVKENMSISSNVFHTKPWDGPIRPILQFGFGWRIAIFQIKDLRDTMKFNPVGAIFHN